MVLDSEVIVPAFELLEGLMVNSPSELVAKLLFSLENTDSEDFVVDGP